MEGQRPQHDRDPSKGYPIFHAGYAYGWRQDPHTTLYEPFVAYLHNRYGDATLPPAYNALPLARLAGYELEIDKRRLFQAQWWHGFIQATPELKKWVRSPEAFHAPERWKGGLSEIFEPLGIEPSDLAGDCVPTVFRALRNNSFLRDSPEFGYLSAFAHGYPVTDEDLLKATRAARRALNHPLFAIWAYNPAIDNLPMPERKRSKIPRENTLTLIESLNSRASLLTDPLACHNYDVLRGLPKNYRTADALAALPRYKWTSRSSRQPLVGQLLKRGKPRV